jgi:DNA polymerase III subunit alpha
MTHPFTDLFTPIKLLNLGLVRFPEVSIPAEDRSALGLKPAMTNRAILGKLAWDGYVALRAKGMFSTVPEEEIKAHFRTEFATFDKTGVHDYLLLVWDYNRWADQQGIVRGWGRGSAASSLTLCCLGITRVDPLRHKLNFPRFISEARMKPVIKDGVTYVDGKAAPDIDCDYQFGRRAEVVQYIERKYAGRTCKISTRLELTGKMALKNALKLYADWKDEDAQRVSDLIEAKFGKVQSLHDAREQNAAVQQWIAANPTNAEIYAVAMAIEGLATTKGQHPSGVFIGYFPLDGTVPIELAKERGGEAATVSSYDMETMAGLGVKVDILGVRTLDLIAGTAKVAGETLDTLNVDDPLIYEYLSRPEANYMGLFQIEEGTTKEAVVKVGPRDIDALSACLAISRPGALKYLDDYAAYKRTGAFKPIYPAIDAVLRPTGNVLTFQEQITRVCTEVFGLTPIDADSVRYAVGKKKREEMAKWEEVLRSQGAQRGIPTTVIQYFWDVCNASADYLFVHCLSPDTVVETPEGDKLMYEVEVGDMVRAFDVEAQCDHYVRVEEVIPSEMEVHEIELEDGRRITASLDHRFLCEDSVMRPLRDIILNGLRVLTD